MLWSDETFKIWLSPCIACSRLRGPKELLDLLHEHYDAYKHMDSGAILNGEISCNLCCIIHTFLNQFNQFWLMVPVQEFHTKSFAWTTGCQGLLHDRIAIVSKASPCSRRSWPPLQRPQWLTFAERFQFLGLIAMLLLGGVPCRI